MANYNVLPYDVNAYLQADTGLIGLLGAGFNIYPLIGKEACAKLPDGSPDIIGKALIRYFWMPGIQSMDHYFMRKDRIRYYVMSRGVDNLFQTAERMVEILDRKDIQPLPIYIPSANNMISEAWLVSSNSMPPNEKLGLAEMSLDFEFRYMQLTATSYDGSVPVPQPVMLTTSTSLTVTNATLIIVTTSGCTITLPSNPINLVITIKLTAAGFCNVVGPGATIDGLSTYEFSGQNTSLTFYGNGTSWLVI